MSGPTGIDHVALPTSHPEAMLRFYAALGFETPGVEAWQQSGVPFFAVACAGQKINFHAPAMWQNAEFTLRGPRAVPGCGDLCFVWSGSMQALRDTLDEAGATLEAGPVELQGGRGRGTSLYTRDPDGNLLEFIVYPDEAPETASGG